MKENNSNWLIGMCSECGSQQSASYMERSPFDKPPCKTCGGVVILVSVPDDEEEAARRIKNAYNQSSSKRGIYRKSDEDPGDQGYPL